MGEQSAAIEWGSWVMGDVPHVLQLASVSVGHGVEVTRAAVTLRQSERELSMPVVSIVLADDAALARVRASLLGDGYVLAPASRPDDAGDQVCCWRAALPGFDLVLEVDKVAVQ
jgi:hypothetical protein